ncbi:MAG: 2-oxoglutarate dehydrogenase E1 subunit family protein, partial [Actinomycetales bacterium]
MTSDSALDRFGPNEWLVEELYAQYQRDKSSVDPAWWPFFEDYRPGSNGAASAPAGEPAVIVEVQPPVTSAPTPVAQPAGAPPVEVGKTPATKAPDEDSLTVFRGPTMRVVENMTTSLQVPTATSVRAVPAKLLIDN